MCHSAERFRISANAARASAICGARPAIAFSGSGRGDRAVAENISRMDCSNPGRSAGVWTRRYLSTNAATPLSASARATFQPSFSMDKVRKPPPGATTTAAPLALAGSGRKGVSVATVTLRANRLPYWLCQDSGFFAPGSGPVPISIALGCEGVAMGVIRSFCAWAGVASAATNARLATTKRERVDPAKAHFIQRFDTCLTLPSPSTVFIFVVKRYYPTGRVVSCERSLADVYNREPIWKVKIARYYWSFVEVNDDGMPEVLVCLFNSPFGGG